jgi:23S rRNA (cytosine1962-C5)-methyltransferase
MSAPESAGAMPARTRAQPTVALSPRGWKRVLSGHPWVFRDDLASVDAESGDFVAILDPYGKERCRGFYSGASKIAIRIVTRRPGAVDERALLVERLDRAAARRPKRGRDEAERLVSAEADDLPGLVVDRYADVVCIQHAIPFWERRRELVAETLRARHSPRAIVARDDFAARTLEGLPRRTEVEVGNEPGELEIREGEVRFAVDPVRGQKTGFFLDQRENRERVARVVRERAQRGKVLDAFTFEGSFALHAARAGAARIVGIDESAPALARAKANAERNGVAERCEWVRANAFDELRARAQGEERYDVVVVDPPAFAKNRADVEKAIRGYVEINLRALLCVAEGGYLATFSCSYNLTDELFAAVLREAAGASGRRVELVERLAQSHDHPIVLTHPESMYLKGALLRLDA